MTSYLHRLAGLLFYVLALSYFVMYMLHFNELLGTFPKWWLHIADLPLAIVAMLYGGMSLYRSVTREDQPSTFVTLLIGIPLTALFALCFVMNFWELLQGEAADSKTFWLNWAVLEAVAVLALVASWRCLDKMSNAHTS